MAPLQAGRDDMKSNQRERWGTLPDCFTFFHSGQAAHSRATAVCRVSGLPVNRTRHWTGDAGVRRVSGNRQVAA